MQVIVIYAGNMVHETAFESMDSALDYLISEEYDADALIEYDGAGFASVFDGALLSSIMTSHIQDIQDEVANEKAMAAGYPR